MQIKPTPNLLKRFNQADNKIQKIDVTSSKTALTTSFTSIPFEGNKQKTNAILSYFLAGNLLAASPALAAMNNNYRTASPQQGNVPTLVETQVAYIPTQPNVYGQRLEARAIDSIDLTKDQIINDELPLKTTMVTTFNGHIYSKKAAILQKMHEINPDLQVVTVIPEQAARIYENDYSRDHEAFDLTNPEEREAYKTKLAEVVGIPKEAFIFISENEGSNTTSRIQEPFLPVVYQNLVTMMVPKGGYPENILWDDLDIKLGIPFVESESAFVGGDMQVVGKTNGEQELYVGGNSLERNIIQNNLLPLKEIEEYDAYSGTATTKTIIDPSLTPEEVATGYVLSIAQMMETYQNQGGKAENFNAIGSNLPISGAPAHPVFGTLAPEEQNITFGEAIKIEDALKAMNEEQKDSISPEIMEILESRKNQDVPISGPNWNLNLFARFNADSESNTVTAIVGDYSNYYPSQSGLQVRELQNRVKDQLEELGIKIVEVPQQQSSGTIPELNYTGYISAIIPEGEANAGKKVIFMPTEAENPDELTDTDQTAYQAFREAFPEAIIKPIGARSAAIRSDMSAMPPDGNIQILPVTIEQLTPN